MRVDLFVIDGQNDFCASGKEPANWPTPEGGRRPGALCVAGADEEAKNVAQMIDELAVNGPEKHLISKIHATLDSHHVNDCAHNTVWRDQSGQVVPPFTIVSHDDIVNHKYTPAFAMGKWDGRPVAPYEWALKYTKALADRGRNPLCLWPEHCLIQKWGASVYQPLQEAYDRWAKKTGGWIDFISKGQNPFTEHYSALEADVPDPSDRATTINAEVIGDAANADIVVWCGWAGSHCLKWTALDAINYFGKTGTNPFIAKSIFLEDASAPVPNPPGGPDFGRWRLDFLDEVVRRGGRVMKIAELIRELRAAA